jgi:ribose-phosphate pyrophosphokinase
LNALLLGVEAQEQSLLHKLHHLTGIPQEKVTCRTFPDGEVCIRINATLAKKTIIIVHDTAELQDMRLQQLYQMVEVAVWQEAERIVCIVPYLAYARQDRRTHSGEPLSGLIVLRTLAMLGADMLVTVDVHNPTLLRQAPLSTENLCTETEFAHWLLHHQMSSPLLVSPDDGGKQRIERLAKLTGYDYVVCTKCKDDTGNTWYEQTQFDSLDHDVFVLDDLCSSGSTFIPLARSLKHAGARNIYYGVTHFFADGHAIQHTLGFLVTIVATDTVLTPWSTMSVAPLLAQWITQDIDKHLDPFR